MPPAEENGALIVEGGADAVANTLTNLKLEISTKKYWKTGREVGHQVKDQMNAMYHELKEAKREVLRYKSEKEEVEHKLGKIKQRHLEYNRDIKSFF